MKALLPLLLLLSLPLIVLSSGEEKQPRKSYKAVFEVSVDGVERWEAALRNVKNARKELGESSTTVEVVAHGEGIGLLLLRTGAANPDLDKALQSLHKEGVVFAACENTMARMKLTKKDLRPEATTVGSGVGEVVRKQSEGWAYVKSGG